MDSESDFVEIYYFCGNCLVNRDTYKIDETLVVLYILDSAPVFL